LAGRRAHRGDLDRIAAKAFGGRTAGAWTPRLEAERIPFALMNDFAEALDDPKTVHRGIVRELDHPASGPIRVVGPPWVMTGSQAEMTPPPSWDSTPKRSWAAGSAGRRIGSGPA